MFTVASAAAAPPVPCSALIRPPGRPRRPGPGPAAVLAAALGLVASSNPAPARTWTILAGGGGSAPTVQAAVDSAVSGDTLQVGPGVFHEHVVVVDKTLLVRGSGRDITEINGYPHGHVFNLRGYANETEIRDLTLRNGYADLIGDVYGGIYGGGIYAEGAYFAVINCRITECYALSLGGGIYFTAQVLPRDGADLPGSRPGSGLAAPPPTRGSRPDGAARQPAGPGRRQLRDTVEILDCILDHNFAGSEGGGFCAEYALFRVENCVIEENHTVDGGGGRIFNSFGSVTGCLIRDNLAEFDGGGLKTEQNLGGSFPTIVVAGNTLVANRAGRTGAGVMISNGVTILIERNLFVDQGGQGGQAIACRLPDGEYHGSCNHFWANGSPELTDCAPESTDTTGDPRFCNPAGGDYRVCTASPVLEGPCGRRGAFGVGCTGEGCSTPALRTTWGAVKSLFR